MRLTDQIIIDLFRSWIGPENGDVELARKQLHKSLTDQMNGFWSGATAYWIMTHGGFLLDAKRGEKKKLTALGYIFMNEMKGGEQMPKTITCPYCGTTKTVRTDAETCGSGVCRMKKSREAKKQQENKK